MGKAIRAIRDEKVGAMLMGINVKRMNYVTFGIGAACAGIAGSVIVPIFHVEPGGRKFCHYSLCSGCSGRIGKFYRSPCGRADIRGV